MGCCGAMGKESWLPLRLIKTTLKINVFLGDLKLPHNRTKDFLVFSDLLEHLFTPSLCRFKINIRGVLFARFLSLP